MSYIQERINSTSQQGQPLLIVAGIEIWIGTKFNILFCNGYNAPTLSSKSTKEVFYVQGACHFPNHVT
jgi:hypothetical protein